jgi:antitoxin component YwqK of YwqJK toxin-antitoxin module
MSKLKNYNSIEGKVVKDFFQDHRIDPYIALIVESYIYKKVINYYYDEPDKVRQKYMIKYGELEGMHQEWNENGQKYIECSYKKNKREGLYQEWYEDGQKCEECYYKEGKQEGLHQSWWPNGKIHIINNYKEGKREGIYQEWRLDGTKWSETNYKNDMREGLYQEWNSSSFKLTEKNYKNDKEEGLQQGVREGTNIRFQYNCKDGKKDGLEEHWYADRQSLPWYMSLSERSDIRESGKNEKKSGEFDYKDGIILSNKGWYENGQIQREYYYNKEGYADGLCEYWFENGQKMWFQNMKEGKKHGELKQWNEQGGLIYHEIYHEGELIEKIL